MLIAVYTFLAMRVLFSCSKVLTRLLNRLFTLARILFCPIKVTNKCQKQILPKGKANVVFHILCYSVHEA